MNETLHDSSYPLADHPLARRLEQAEGRTNAACVEGRAELFPDTKAVWMQVAGGWAMFDGVDSPLTQTFGLGLFDSVSPEELDRVESFFRERGAPVFHEVSPLAEPDFLAKLPERGYRPLEFTSVLYRPIGPGCTLSGSRDETIQVRRANDRESAIWAETAAKGWSDILDVAALMREMSQINATREEAFSFLAEREGAPIAAGTLYIVEGVALLGGASTIPEQRRRGAQLALLEHRLQFGAERGCDLAMMCAQPGSGSQRNAERHGFRIAYTRIKWHLPSS